MTNKNRIRVLASLVRISDAKTAADISRHARITTGDLGGGIAGQMRPGLTPGICIDDTWIRTASDEELDKVVAHELVHAAYAPGGEALRKAIGDFAYLRARVLPKCAAADYNAATDLIMNRALGWEDGKPPLMARIPEGFLKDRVAG